jgi:hypothetical protein
MISEIGPALPIQQNTSDFAKQKINKHPSPPNNLSKAKVNISMKTPPLAQQAIHKRITFIRKSIFWSFMLGIFYIILNLSSCQYKKYQLFKQPPIGRDYHSLSLHPNGQEILFIECADTLSGCGILRYHLKTQHLQRYQLPEGYEYFAANFSPQGNYIVIQRNPLTKKYQENLNAAQQEVDIMIIRENSQELRILPLPIGAKIWPIMSNNEDKIAYWMVRPYHLFMGFNIWEFELNTLTYQLFAGDLSFSEIGSIQYMPDDQALLVNASELGNNYLRYEKIFHKNYETKYSNSSIYLLPRHSHLFPAPLFTQIRKAWPIKADKENNLYLLGYLDQEEIPRIFKSSHNRLVQNWAIPNTLKIRELVINSTENKALLIYGLPDNSPSFDKYSYAIGQFDLNNNTWQEIPIPPLHQANTINTVLQ